MLSGLVKILMKLKFNDLKFIVMKEKKVFRVVLEVVKLIATFLLGLEEGSNQVISSLF